jgi:predicted nuclease of predicted toxin-antitoxin system
MKILVDMNLSPEWIPLLQQHGFDAVHWISIGKPNAPDADIMQWAHDHQAVVFTHDLDFGILLALAQRTAPSVIQARAQDVSPEHLGGMVLRVLSDYRLMLEKGALITIDEARARVRILPI